MDKSECKTVNRQEEISMTEHFDEDGFSTAVASGVALVDFWATWCMPCRMVAPVIDKLAEDFDGRAVVGKVDVDEQGMLAARFGIQSIPTVMIFRDGTPVNTLVGVRDYSEYAAALEEALRA